MKLGEFRKLTENVSDDSELVLWCYFDVLDEDGMILRDTEQAETDFHLDISDWTHGRKALHFTLDAQKVYDGTKAHIH